MQITLTLNSLMKRLYRIYSFKRFALATILVFSIPASLQGITTEDLASSFFARLTGGKALSLQDPRRATIVSLMNQNKFEEAADIAINDSGFCNNVIRNNWNTEMSGGLAMDPAVRLTDSMAFFIKVGCIDEQNGTNRSLGRDFRSVFTLDAHVEVDPTKLTSSQNSQLPPFTGNGVSQFTFIDDQGISLDSLMLVSPQSTLVPDSAGALTLNGYGEKLFDAGTNRRAIEEPLMDFTCQDVRGDFFDTSLPDDDVTGDVSRLPFTDYQVNCRGCHSFIDALRPAAARHNWSANTRVVTWNGSIQAKINDPVRKVEASIPNLTTTSWLLRGFNSNSGWRGKTSGTKYREYIEMLVNSFAFSKCTAEKIFKYFCHGKQPSTSEKSELNRFAADFERDGYRLPFLYRKIAAQFYDVCIDRKD